MVNGNLALVREVERGARPSPLKERETTGVRLINNLAFRSTVGDIFSFAGRCAIIIA